MKPFDLRYKCKETGLIFAGRKLTKDICELQHPVTGLIIRYSNIRNRKKHFIASSQNEKVARKRTQITRLNLRKQVA